MRVEWSDNSAPGILRGLLDAKLAYRAVNAAARSYKSDVLAFIGQGAAFTARKGGPLEKSIKWRTDGPGALAFTKARHAAILEGGSRPHAIEPKARRGGKALKFSVGEGGFLFRKRAQHPGTAAEPFFFADFAAREARMAAAAAAAVDAKLRSAT